MNVLVYLLPIALALGGMGLCAFLWALRNGQYEDLDGAALRVLTDDDLEQKGLSACQGSSISMAPWSGRGRSPASAIPMRPTAGNCRPRSSGVWRQRSAFRFWPRR